MSSRSRLTETLRHRDEPASGPSKKISSPGVGKNTNSISTAFLTYFLLTDEANDIEVNIEAHTEEKSNNNRRASNPESMNKPP